MSVSHCLADGRQTSSEKNSGRRLFKGRKPSLQVVQGHFVDCSFLTCKLGAMATAHTSPALTTCPYRRANRRQQAPSFCFRTARRDCIFGRFAAPVRLFGDERNRAERLASSSRFPQRATGLLRKKRKENGRPLWTSCTEENELTVKRTFLVSCPLYPKWW